MSHQPSLSDLVLPQPTLSSVLSSVKKSSLSAHNRLRSIRHDAAFVSAAASSPLGRGRPSAYFKSTDGHTGQWKFSSRRLNLHLFGLIEENNGIIIVDSTRRGKPLSTHAQITALLPSYLAALRALDLDLAPLRAALTKPLRPFWVTPDTTLPLSVDEEEEGGGDGATGTGAGKPAVVFDDAHPIICLTASNKSSTSEMSTAFEGYVQGAADDTEHWAMGLTAPSSADECRISFVSGPASPPESWQITPELIEVRIGNPRQASKNLRSALPEICAFVARFSESHPAACILVSCPTGKDLAVATALALRCYFFDTDDMDAPFRVPKEVVINKAAIRARLGRIMLAFPEGNPQRATLQSVNSFLMG
ncbi:unnamed protein product [Parascedosporium putredinis]|uniref:Initiator tRNA phosphoribosyl transferase n=1 Tax=Parascedosporium putredinis TaxID=1442378 RepID=A0A9P1H0R6_9PEZI|nr:unnamed protein product [Parascedosporium putredinis]CAI7992955.1 unnamed protein product [Parascedosporium putredinis]